MNYKTILLISFLFLLTSCNSFGESIEVKGGEVFYQKPVTATEAQALADYLIEIGYFKDETVTVQLLKDDEEYTVNFVLQEGKSQDSTIQDIFREMSPLISYAVFDGAIVNIGLCDENLETEYYIPGFNYGKLIYFDKDKLYYTDNVDRETAEKFGDYLVKTTFFSNRGLEAQLTKKDDTYQFRYIVKKGYEKKQDYKKTAEEYAELLSKRVFDNAPVEIHMCDENWNTLLIIEYK